MDNEGKNVYIIRHEISFDPLAMDLLNGILDAIAATDRVSPASQRILDDLLSSTQALLKQAQAISTVPPTQTKE